MDAAKVRDSRRVGVNEFHAGLKGWQGRTLPGAKTISFWVLSLSGCGLGAVGAIIVILNIWLTNDLLNLLFRIYRNMFCLVLSIRFLKI